ncbi:B-cell receptor CD22-like [Esox lucius]|uniref:B-cell receptor CD22-like n=1 Tax=Esox lucius TaxID=8010 RepID=UPI001477114D|nr:B-cell receptor CD22-like [Esox lucius]
MDHDWLNVLLLLNTLLYCGHSQDKIKPVVTLKPNSPILIGETVTIRCDIQGGGDTDWEYNFYKNGQSVYSDTNPEYRISPVCTSHTGSYTCMGVKGNKESITSDAVQLTVSYQSKAVLSISPQWMNPGDSVTLNCEVKESSTGWRFSWYKTVPYRAGLPSLLDKSYSVEPLSGYGTTEESYTLSPAGPTDTGGYVCRAGRGDPVYYTDYSEPQFLWSGDKLKPVVTLKPNSPIFRGETVTIRCVIEGGDSEWEYDFIKNDQSVYSDTKPEYRISPVYTSHTGSYTCMGVKRNKESITSDAVQLTVFDLPRASVKIVSPQEPLYTGDRVTLQCNIPEYTDWTYVWYRDHQYLPSQTSKTITVSLPINAGQYQCQGKRTDQPQSSYMSPNHPISVTALPTASVSVSPHGLLYSGETVTLQCDISDYTDWTYWWYRKDQLQSPGSPSKTITTLSDQVSQYQCQGRRTDRPQSSQRSVYLHISVTANQPKATLSSDQKDILTGDNVTLTCTVESSGWRFYWYRHRQDSEPVATTSGSSYTLSQVSVSDGGQYRCRAGRGDPVYYTQYSEPVHIQVTVPGSSTSVLVGVVVGPVVAVVLLTIFLVLLCRGCCGKRIFQPIHPQSTNQDPQQDQGSTQVQSPDAGYTGNSNIYHLIHHPDNNDNDSAGVSAADGSGDVKYDKIQLKKLDKKKREKPDDPNKNKVYSEMKTVKTTASSGPVDVTYSEIDLKTMNQHPCPSQNQFILQ